MEFKLGNSIINSYKRLSYDPWFAFAEFVDNSTQAFFNNREELESAFLEEGKCLEVIIEYSPENDEIIIKDNSYGMNEESLQKAMTLGLTPDFDKERSKYGLGMKTAAFWFGDNWSITTSQLGEDIEHKVEVNINKIMSVKPGESIPIGYTVDKATAESHYTIIKIKDLNRNLRGRTLAKIRDYLSSIYRIDFITYGLKLYWQDKPLSWDDLESKLYITEDGKRYKKKLDFELSNGKKVTGWVGVFGKGHGGRKNAGFSIIKSNRVIEGWPRGYKPNSIFGDLDDGVNDLVNQRVVGELFLDDFEVSHTKDAIVWLDNEQSEIDELLGDECSDAIHLAKTIRFKSEANEVNVPALRNEAISVLESELKSSEFNNYINSVHPPEEKVLEIALDSYKDKSKQGRDADINVEIGLGNSKITVTVYFIENSEFDPYVVIESSVEQNTIIVIINALHPHFIEMSNSETIENFVRHCIYDGVAEWKAIKLLGRIQPYTIKNLKDGLLRLPFSIKQNKF